MILFPFQIFGFSVLLGIIFLLALVSLWCDCCKCCSSSTAVYDAVILEQREKLSKEHFREDAKEEWTEMEVRKQAGTQDKEGTKNKWVEPLIGVAANMTETSDKTGTSIQQQNPQQCPTEDRAAPVPEDTAAPVPEDRAAPVLENTAASATGATAKATTVGTAGLNND